jgi:hypothetical protein
MAATTLLLHSCKYVVIVHTDICAIVWKLAYSRGCDLILDVVTRLYVNRFGSFSVVDRADSVYRELYHPDEPSESAFGDDGQDDQDENGGTTIETNAQSQSYSGGRTVENRSRGRGRLANPIGGSRVVGEGVVSLLEEDK